MKFGPLLICLALAAVTLTALSRDREAEPLLELELTEHYDTAEPFLHEKLFSVKAPLDTLELEVTVRLEGAAGRLEVADNVTGAVYWSGAWEGDLEEERFTVTLTDLSPKDEYVVRFTGTGIHRANITLRCQDPRVSEQARPRGRRPEKEALPAGRASCPSSQVR